MTGSYSPDFFASITACNMTGGQVEVSATAPDPFIIAPSGAEIDYPSSRTFLTTSNVSPYGKCQLILYNRFGRDSIVDIDFIFGLICNARVTQAGMPNSFQVTQSTGFPAPIVHLLATTVGDIENDLDSLKERYAQALAEGRFEMIGGTAND